MTNLQFSVTGFYRPATCTVLGPAVLFPAPSVAAAKIKAKRMLSDLAQQYPGKYPDPEVRTDWADVFFHQLSVGEDPAADMGLTKGNWVIQSFKKDGKNYAPPILFFADDNTAEQVSGDILRKVCESGYLSFPDPDVRDDFFKVFVSRVEI